MWTFKDIGKTLNVQRGRAVANRNCRNYEEPSHPYMVGDEVVVETLKKGRAQGDFVYGPPTSVVAVTRKAVLTEQSPIWIHATRVKLAREREEEGQEVLTGADSPDLQRGPEALTEADSLDLEEDTVGVLTEADSLDPQQDDTVRRFFEMAEMQYLDNCNFVSPIHCPMAVEQTDIPENGMQRGRQSVEDKGELMAVPGQNSELN
ncbi:uncharacterized protein LOC122944514 [Bufo gargarizans]|uniref:uncharacterized protein LOC122944514 n=1 Tax=Bufo gargarizans TaxID=30331 RepID=UPI001CF3C88E|nr:uncharacterized protein LOC122944514 [Bufo gargarizans]